MPAPLTPFSRRRFLQGSAAAAAVGSLARGSRVIPANDPDVLKVGFVGCGARGTGACAQALRAEDGTVVLTAMADVFPEKIDRSLEALRADLGEELAGRIQVPPEQRFVGFDAFERLLQTDVDVVIVTTPPHFRPQHVEAVIGAGKHLFAEKPMAVDAPGIRRILAAAAQAKQKKLSFVSGYCWRKNVRHRELYGRVLDGAIGDVRAVYSTYLTYPNRSVQREPGWSDMEFHLRNWYVINWVSGDHVVEQACHSLDKMAWAFDDVAPLSCTAVGGRQARDPNDGGNNYDHFSATFEYPNGARGFHMCRQMADCPGDNNDWIYGTKGDATVMGWVPHHEITGENPWIYEGEGNQMYQQEHDELFASIRKGEPINDGVWASHSTLLGIMTRMAAYTGQVVTWEQAMASEERLGPDTYAFGPVAMNPVAIPGKTPLF